MVSNVLLFLIVSASLLSTLLSQQSFYDASNSAFFRITGRYVTDLTSKLILFDWSATQIHFALSGTCSQVSIKVENSNSFFNVYLDNILQPSVLQIRKGTTEYSLSGSVSKLTNTQIKLVKRSEPQFENETVKFYGVKLNGNCTLSSNIASQNARLIEFIGNSDTCAYGNEATPKSSFTPSSQNADNGYASMVARRFNAEFSLICVSGIGAVYSLDARQPNMQKRYNNYTYYPNNIASSFTANPSEPDLIVTYLGGNDWFNLYSSNFAQKTLDEFTASYAQFLGQIRNANIKLKNGKLAPILVMAPGSNTASTAQTAEEMNIVSSTLIPLIKKAVEQAGGNSKEIYFGVAEASPPIEIKNEADWGSDLHWSVKGHEKFANGVTPLVEKVTGWKSIKVSITPNDGFLNKLSRGFLFLIIFIFI
jgi:lysophospholipase L1-like esterase